MIFKSIKDSGIRSLQGRNIYHRTSLLYSSVVQPFNASLSLPPFESEMQTVSCEARTIEELSSHSDWSPNSAWWNTSRTLLENKEGILGFRYHLPRTYNLKYDPIDGKNKSTELYGFLMMFLSSVSSAGIPRNFESRKTGHRNDEACE